MQRIARVGDRVTGICNHGYECCPHHITGQFIEGSQTMIVNGLGVVRTGDRCQTTCPHCGTGYAEEGSNTVFADGKPIHLCGQRVRLGGGWGTSQDGTGTVFSDR